MKVAILGPRGTFSEEAALKFDARPELILCKDVEEIFEGINKKAEFGIVPVENSLEGSVGMTLELLRKKDARIFGEVILDIQHSLVALPETKLGDIREVISHPQALAQCKSFLKGLGVKTRNFSSTAEAAKEIAEKNLKNTAAAAPKVSARLYGLKILKEDIQDEDSNQTRFLIIGKEDHRKTGMDKTSLILGLVDKPGALYETLREFATRKINLTKIESRPSRKALGDYIFYIDFEGHREDIEVKEALKELKNKATFIKVLGSYPRGEVLQ